ncbi:tetratricopeptide repeat protein [Candidatus Comchoanobacter bicostacola]|uniref:Tetratricopeptide repeat protein n=1 Tax=Candidatus Comchoanobacter bicostacola TaxID=2919598 RepID=A0ABY5DK73_9GAMM|nr:tetratricopeptide repeat protein [Candidatus Comchoanobacter bicostacola]UTC24886.1 tetratricopeptide repeat protein [Candidatus Comchoanobacter bicostacola]
MNDHIDAQDAYYTQWIKNHSSQILTLTACLLIIAGAWEYRESNIKKSHTQAQTLYETYLVTPEASIAKNLKQSYPKQIQTHLVMLDLAKKDFDAQKTQSAIQKLEWVKSQSPIRAINAVASYRIAMIQIDQDNTLSAQQLLAESEIKDPLLAASLVISGAPYDNHKETLQSSLYPEIKMIDQYLSFKDSA